MKPDFLSKIKDKTALSEWLLQNRSAGRRIVFTNGCFDLLHTGHVTYLDAAARLGDILLVAVNDDESVRRLKGPSRPVCPLGDRMVLLAALGMVGAVTSFAEDTPLELILQVRPDVLVKGGDYRPDDIVGSREVLSGGGEVHTIPFVAGYSTTSLINRLS